MGTMTTLFGGGSSKDINSKSQILGKATDATVITPLNPGKFGSIRSTPIVEAPRYFTKEEMDAMKALAKDKTEGARQAKRAYKALSRIEEADAKVHKSHRAYTTFIK
jgi:hypothetical protein